MTVLDRQLFKFPPLFSSSFVTPEDFFLLVFLSIIPRARKKNCTELRTRFEIIIVFIRNGFYEKKIVFNLFVKRLNGKYEIFSFF